MLSHNGIPLPGTVDEEVELSSVHRGIEGVPDDPEVHAIEVHPVPQNNPLAQNRLQLQLSLASNSIIILQTNRHQHLKNNAIRFSFSFLFSVVSQIIAIELFMDKISFDDSNHNLAHGFIAEVVFMLCSAIAAVSFYFFQKNYNEEILFCQFFSDEIKEILEDPLESEAKSVIKNAEALSIELSDEISLRALLAAFHEKHRVVFAALEQLQHQEAALVPYIVPQMLFRPASLPRVDIEEVEESSSRAEGVPFTPGSRSSS